MLNVQSTFICGENIPRKNSKIILFIFRRIYQIGLRQNVSELRFWPKSWEQDDGKLKQQTNRVPCIRKDCNYYSRDIEPNHPRTNFLKTIGCYLTLLLRFISVCHLIIKCRQCTQWWLHDTYNLESVNSGFTNDISRSWYSIVHIICLRM